MKNRNSRRHTNNSFATMHHKPRVYASAMHDQIVLAQNEVLQHAIARFCRQIHAIDPSDDTTISVYYTEDGKPDELSIRTRSAKQAIYYAERVHSFFSSDIPQDYKYLKGTYTCTISRCQKNV